MVAIAAVFIDILQIVARCGLPDAVVQRADSTRISPRPPSG